jgi:hypothetical protein
MSGLSPEILITVAILVLIAIAAGTLAARLFIAASRTHGRPAASEEDA